nr:SpaA isopeptide-forming pilin-related protein [uncultured Eubacterium sp.]
MTNGKELPGCHMQVIDKDTGKVMDEWVSSRQSHVIEGKYAVGKTYVLTETKARGTYYNSSTYNGCANNRGTNNGSSYYRGTDNNGAYKTE